MKQESQPVAVVVTGLPGTGKSVLAGAIAARRACLLIAKDAVKEPLFDVLGAPTGADSRRLSDASFAVLFRLATDYVRNGWSIVLEGNFRHGEHAAALGQALEPARVLQVLCVVEESERRARLAARADDSWRHPLHRDREVLEAPSPEAQFLALPGERLPYRQGKLLAEYEANDLAAIEHTLDRLGVAKRA
jgi:predicted kinase